MTLGGTQDINFTLLDSDLDALDDGFNSITIGRGITSTILSGNPISLANNLVFKDPVIFETNRSTGFNTNGYSITGDTSISIQSDNGITISPTSLLTSSGNPIDVILNADSDGNGTGNLTLDGSILTNGGDFILEGANLTLTNTLKGTVDTSGTAQVGAIRLISPGNITLNTDSFLFGSLDNQTDAPLLIDTPGIVTLGANFPGISGTGSNQTANNRGSGLRIGETTKPSQVIIQAATLPGNQTFTTNGNDFIIRTTGNLTLPRNVVTNGGNILLEANRITTDGYTLNTSAPTLPLDASGTLKGNLTLRSTTDITTGGLTFGATALGSPDSNLFLDALGTITLNDTITTHGGSLYVGQTTPPQTLNLNLGTGTQKLETFGGEIYLSSTGTLSLNRTIETQGGNLTIIANRINATCPTGAACNSFNTTGILDLANNQDGSGGNILLKTLTLENNASSIQFSGDLLSAGANLGLPGGTIRLETISAPILFDPGTINTTGDIYIVSDSGTIDTVGGTINGNNIFLQTNSSPIRLSNSLTNSSGNLSISSNTGEIDTRNVVLRSETGNLALTALNAPLTTGFISSLGGDISLSGLRLTALGEIRTGQRVDLGTTATTGGNLSLTAINDLTAVGLNTVALNQGGAIQVQSTTGSLTLGSVLTYGLQGHGGAITLTAPGPIQYQTLNSVSNLNYVGNSGDGGAITLTSSTSSITGTGEILSKSNRGTPGTISVSGVGSLLLGGFNASGVTQGGNITLTSSQGSVQTLDLVSNGGLGVAGTVDITAQGDIRTQRINLSSDNGGGNVVFNAGGNIRIEQGTETVAILTSGGSQAGGSVTLTSGGTVELVGPLSLSSFTANGADLRVEAVGQITTTDITTSGNNGGDITLISRGVNGGINTTGGILNALGGNNGGNISLQSVGDINTADITVLSSGFQGNSGSLSLTSTEGHIDTSQGILTASAQGSGGDVTLNALKTVAVGGINARSLRLPNAGGAILFQGATPNSNAEQIILTTGLLTTNGNNITFDVPTLVQGDFAINLSGPLSSTGNITFADTLDGPGSLTLTTANTSPITLQGSVGGITPLTSLILNAPTQSTNPSNQLIHTSGPLTAQTITSPNGLTLISDTSTITTSNLISPGQAISATAADRLTLGNVTTASPTSSGGAISLTSQNAFIDSSNLSSQGTTGGNITVQASTAIRTGTIISQGTQGNGGNVLLDPSGDIEVTSINAQGIGIGALGGSIDITTGRFFRATSSFSDQYGTLASLSSAGGSNTAEDGGSIIIRHGGQGIVPFTVGTTPITAGDTSANGSSAAITRGTSAPLRTIPSASYPYTHSQDPDPTGLDQDPDPSRSDPGRLQIVSVPNPDPNTPIPPQPPNLPPDLPLTPIDAAPLVNPTPQNPILSLFAPNPLTLTPFTSPPSVQITEVRSLDLDLLSADPIVQLAYLVGDTLEAETNIEQDPETGSYDLNWYLPEGDRTLSLDVNITQPLIETLLSLQPETQGIELDAQDFPRLDLLPLQTLEQLNIGPNDDIISLLDQQFEAEYEEHYSKNFSDKRVTAASVRQVLKTIEKETGTRAVIVYAVSLPDHLDLALVMPEGPPVRRIVPQAPAHLLNQRVKDLREAVTNLNTSPRQYQGLGQQLHSWLVEPIQDQLEALNIDTLIYIMDGGLRLVPLAALYDGEQFLVEQYSLGMLPSMSLTNSTYQALTTQSTEILAMGASEFSNQAPLPAVPTELDWVSRRDWRGSAFLNQDFTRNNLVGQRYRQSPDILHLATHADFIQGSPQDSYIQLWDQQLKIDELRELEWSLPPQIEMLVLSACNTAVGDIDSELGFAGLSVQAGVKSVLASLWKVNDAGTLALMGEFYRRLAQDTVTIKAEGLRQAQLAMLRGELVLVPEGSPLLADSSRSSSGGEEAGSIVYWPIPEGLDVSTLEEDLSHPYYWSAFTLVGSPW